MQLFKRSLFVLISLFSLPSFAYTPVAQLPEGSRAALLVESLVEQDTLIDTHNRELFFPPASTLKLVTALAAKLELGDQFRFETQLKRVGKDIVIHFSGDPTLTTEDLKQLFVVAKRNGLRHIEGDIWLDNSAFTGYDRAVGWPWDILGVCYSAPATAISLDGNCVQASIYTQDDGDTRVYVPEHFPIYVTTQALSVSKDQQESTQCDLELISSPDNHYQLQGCLTKRIKPLPLKFAVQNPELYTQRMLNNVLNQLDLSFKGSVRVGMPKHTESDVLLATHSSLPLSKLLETMLKKSDNLIADNLTKTLGARFYIQPGSFSNGTQAIKQIIFSNTGVDLESTPLADGSGLSRNNRFTSHAMAKILRYIWLNNDKLKLIELMPKSGESGTLKYRRSMRKAPVKGAFIAKSGSLYGSYNMAGFGLDHSGKPSTLFVQYVADYLPPKKKSDGKPTIAAITQFETLFYKDIVKFSQAIPKK
ncbi:serine-type D-Ala-D-Ala carboxypeptidase [Vibrio sp. Isolate25]|uniref:serine-type D-Ala-D-Ala carboxypeptidase n=1 Tax=Vibrio TaxID=662 RepID=UPI001EFCC8BE|nr:MULTISPECIES: serine-type D-Ala-D-Ala carboxypeptidase [Vibrio]MCG9598093.1 serine-type D-Ala-D-Ala carboxypeptidase [Vibrio sp. Isolate25]USD33240.1 serine-type D-Ala-D-Ala carboxypeptidase [Vibrio sp. SCSIO 43186]USD46310.1 serine-type D-Ala-D-Ala carboxypeptidase [Vibrio sp. SCSIO 43145]USD70364.1 serine-type D-Ala-D-Ala carboxypeptidase [Vibrio sp. SCSIO 43139]USD95282.1 serine-type D-Ala-D-Ala carboxypeptidase [Vibrio coralliilyticus]